MNNYKKIKEVREKHKPFQVWKTSRGNYRAMDAQGNQRSFKKHAEAMEWLKSTREKKAEKAQMKVKGITTKSELKKVISFIRKQIKINNEYKRSGGEPGKNIDFENVIRKVLAALSKIHTKLM